MNDGLHVVHVRVVDAATGRPTAVRMRFQGLDGRRFVPLGRSPIFPTDKNQEVGLQVRLAGSDFAYVDGSCEILLPADPVEVEIVKGPEYAPIEKVVTLGPGKMALRFVIERKQNLPALGWYSGDCRCHELSPHAALLEGAAEGLAVVNLLARQRLSQFQEKASAHSPLEAFSGQAPCLASAESTVVVNTFNVHPKLGSLALLSSHRPVFPLLAGETGFEDWTLGDWCGQCHRKKGLAVWCEPAFWSSDFQDTGAPEGLAQLLSGHVDAVEVAGPLQRYGAEVWTNWYALLEAGFRIPLAGASGKESNDQLIGQSRTYAFLGRNLAFDYSSWIEAVRAGTTCVSDGPWIELEVDENLPGATVVVLGADQRLQVKINVLTLRGGGALELVGNGEVIAQATPDEAYSASIMNEIPASALRWLAARYRRADGSCAAHTSPIYLKNPATGSPVKSATLCMLQAVLQRGAEWAASKAAFRLERNREGLVAIFRDAIQAIDKRCS